jgi:phospholipase C
VSWRIYQNEISFDSGLDVEQAAWLGGFTDNAIEWFPQFNVRFAKSRRAYLPTFLGEAPARIRAKEDALRASGISEDERKKLQTELDHLRAQFAAAQAERPKYTDAAWDALSAHAKALHEKAFTTNVGDPRFRSLTTLAYQDGAVRRETRVPAGDVLHQFRHDVAAGALPAVSWLVAPENFSDHPSAPWYGAWYVSEVLDILTKQPDIWKKTILVLCYDENDGYFDHVPPFVAPHPSRPETGKASPGINTTAEWANVHGRESSIGLGYRVPLVVASPWSRGGCVNSQVFDHTSIIQFLELWTAAKGKPFAETNISDWRRTVCGDLTSVFRPYDGETITRPASLDRDATVERIHAAKFRDAPRAGSPLTEAEISSTSVRSFQEPGTRPSCPLPYDLVVNADLHGAGLMLVMSAKTSGQDKASRGAPFNVCSYRGSDMAFRSYAVRTGDVVRDTIPFEPDTLVRVDGPNGFMREFSGAARGVTIAVDRVRSGPLAPALRVHVANNGTAARQLTIRDESYGTQPRTVVVDRGKSVTVPIDAAPSHGWYDFTVTTAELKYRYAGRVETGEWSITDPAMGRDT